MRAIARAMILLLSSLEDVMLVPVAVGLGTGDGCCYCSSWLWRSRGPGSGTVFIGAGGRWFLIAGFEARDVVIVDGVSAVVVDSSGAEKNLLRRIRGYLRNCILPIMPIIVSPSKM